MLFCPPTVNETFKQYEALSRCGENKNEQIQGWGEVNRQSSENTLCDAIMTSYMCPNPHVYPPKSEL